MIRIAVCDDEKYYREKIQTLLEQYLVQHGLDYGITQYGSGKDFLDSRRNAVCCDILFLDINMDELDGIRTAERIRSFQPDIHIVFVTAFINYALEGYKVNAVRYIMKDMLETAIIECMDAVLKKMQLQKVVFSFSDGDRKIDTDTLLYVESRLHKVVFRYRDMDADGDCIYDKLDNIESKLTQYGFLRIHKSYLVNMKHIQKISNYRAVLDNGEALPIPRLRFQSVKELYVEYRGAL